MKAGETHGLDELLAAFDAGVARRVADFFARWGRYHRLDVRGLDHIPGDAALLVGNHNGGFSPVDGLFLAPYYRARGFDAPVHILAHDMLFLHRRAARWLARVGIIPATPGNGLEVLRRGRKLLVFPGGDLENMRGFRARRRVAFHGRIGFARLALRAGVPIVPVVSAGAHEIFVVLSEGRHLARRLGIDALLRVNTIPVALSLPWGLVAGPTMALPYFPLPARITVQVCEPVDPAPFARAHATDDAAAEALAAAIEATMQRTLDDLYAERRLPVVG